MSLPNPDLMLLAYYIQSAQRLCAMRKPENEDVDFEKSDEQISANEKCQASADLVARESLSVKMDMH